MKESKIVEATISQLDKEFGEGTVISGDAVSVYDNVLSTGSLVLDDALGIGGYPMGSIIEMFGNPSVGKTTLALSAVSKAQEQGMLCVFVDAEHGLDPGYAENLGVDLSEVLISQPTHAQEALTIVDKMARTGDVSLIVVDSVAALVPKEELEGNVEKDHIARQARIMSQFLRRIAGFVHQTGCLVIFVNQTRQKIGGFGFGPTSTTSGGTALKFYAHARLEIKSIGQIKDGENIIGNHTRVKIVKNKHAPPFKTADFDIVFGKGIDTYGEVLDIAINKGIVKKSGAWFKMDDENIGQGRFNTIEYIMQEDVLKDIKGRIANPNGKETQVEDSGDASEDDQECPTEL